MITRSQMRRQLRAQGGIMSVAPGTIGGGDYTGIPMGSRTGFGIVSKIKDITSKINESFLSFNDWKKTL